MEHKEELFNLPEGIVLLRTPKTLSAASVQDLEDRLELIVRQLKRAAAEDTAAEK
jgi:hypothetical protein